MKLCIYTICLNEERNVAQWLETTREADLRIVVDTGSIDSTSALLRLGGVTVATFKPKKFRFDAARQFALDQIPDNVDMAIVCDMDETFRPGWREQVEEACRSNFVTKIHYTYIDELNPDGGVKKQFIRDAIHCPKRYYWKYPCHEGLALKPSDSNGDTIEKTIHVPGIVQEHHHPEGKSRDYYLPLLKLGYEEMPEDKRAVFSYGRELFRRKQFHDADLVLSAYLRLKDHFPPEHSAALRYLAEMDNEKSLTARDKALKKKFQKLRIQRLELACSKYPEGREPWIDLADALADNGEILDAKASVMAALKITEKQPLSFTEERVWGEYPQQLLAYIDDQLAQDRAELRNRIRLGMKKR